MTEKQIRLDPREQVSSKCAHFNGVRERVCEAGVSYQAVRDRSRKGLEAFPCFRSTLFGEPLDPPPCARRAWPTQEAIDAEVAESDARAAHIEACAAAGACRECGAPVEPTRKVVLTLYASCGHRLGVDSEDPFFL